MKNSKILIVEDETLIAMSIKSTLSAMGHEICGIASSGYKALDLAASNAPDLVLMDVKIKGEIDGVKVAEILKKDRGIPVVFLTAFSNQDILERAKACEPLGYVLKPFKENELRSVVEVALYKARMEKEIRKLNQELESKVQDRTRKLTEEIQLRRHTEIELRRHSDNLHKANKALNETLENRGAEKRAIEEAFYLRVNRHLLPYLDFILERTQEKDIVVFLEGLKQMILEMIQPMSNKQFSRYMNLTPQEIRVADLIRHGKPSKEISRLLHLAPGSVATYRNHIRKKLGLLKSGTNLHTFLRSVDS
jgi:DNA-binding NarL/FixJ family response regulator